MAGSILSLTIYDEALTDEEIEHLFDRANPDEASVRCGKPHGSICPISAGESMSSRLPNRDPRGGRAQTAEPVSI